MRTHNASQQRNNGSYQLSGCYKGLTFTLCVLVLLAFFLGGSPRAARAGDEQPGILTLEEAVEMALKNSKALQQAENEVEKARIERDDAWDLYNAVLINTHIPGTDMYVSVPTGADPQGQVYRTDYAWKAAQKDYETLKEATTASVYKNYFNVLLARAQLEAADKSLAAKDRELRDANVRWQVGMEVAFNVDQKRAAVLSERAKLAQAEDTLNKAYADLVQLVGLPAGSRPELSRDIDIQPLEVDDLNTAIRDIIDASPDIWKAEQAVKLQENTYAMLNSADVDRYNLRNARLNVDIAKDRLYLSVLGLYYNVKAIENSYSAAKEAAETAAEALRITRLQYDLGMATTTEVLAAEAALAAAEQQLLNLAVQHQLAVKAFWQPWAWSGSSAS